MRKIFLLLILVSIVPANNLPAAGSNDPAASVQPERRRIENRQHHNKRYTKDNFTVFYRGRKVQDASANSFVDLGEGYGKDNWSVFYEGRKVQDVSANSFQNLGDGYGKDFWSVFYEGRKVQDASANSFQNMGKGYGKDAWNVFYKGRKIDGTIPVYPREPERGRPGRHR